tara:strand:+ start:421 stop:822 length:402 start_codon:yes stop_codon:yes gene_type:complete
MKRLLFSILILLNSSLLFGQIRRGGGKRSYEFGLPDGDEVWKYLLIAIPFIIVGILIGNTVWWSKTDEEKKNVSSTANNFGCFGIVLIGVGFVCLFPLLTWIEYIFVSIYSVVITLFIVAVLIYGIYSLFKRN